VTSIHVNPDDVQTNMVFMQLPDGAADGLRNHLAERGILLGGGSKQIRLVTHLDVTQDDVALLVTEISQYFG
jgi:threonine aldolase